MQTDHWIVRTNYQNRTASFLMLFAIVGAQMATNNAGPAAWAFMGFVLVVYPHLVYWRARRSVSPYRCEMNNLLLDSFLFGICAALLGFPTWISFSLLIGTALTHVLYRGIAGVLRSLAAMVLSAVASSAILGWQIPPQTTDSATALCIIGLTLYLLSLANVAYLRTCKLHDSRQKLHANEQALHAVNTALQEQLVQIQLLQVQLSDQANHDALTGLYNRRYLDTAMAHELARCAREDSALCVMLLDIDFFKRVNDDFSHLAGDEVLKKLSATLMRLTRASDIVCRYGGEEFLVILPNTPIGPACEKAEQLRLEFAGEPVAFGGAHIEVTLSIGVASYPVHGQTPQELIRCADLALYQAKSTGRNRTVVATAHHFTAKQ
jgi:diguanylate cyclase (GGDEF)-like protein